MVGMPIAALGLGGSVGGGWGADCRLGLGMADWAGGRVLIQVCGWWSGGLGVPIVALASGDRWGDGRDADRGLASAWPMGRLLGCRGLPSTSGRRRGATPGTRLLPAGPQGLDHVTLGVLVAGRRRQAEPG
jgi:hypothetical protein